MSHFPLSPGIAALDPPLPPHLPEAGPWPCSVPRAPMVNTTQELGSASPGGLRRLDSGGSNGVPEKRLQMTPLPRGLAGAELESADSRTR